LQRFGRIDILVNNAGATGQAAFQVDDAAWQPGSRNQADGARVHCARSDPAHERQGGGRIINLNMVAAKQPGASSFPPPSAAPPGSR